MSKESPVCKPRARLGWPVSTNFRVARCSVTDLLSARTLPRLNLLCANANEYRYESPAEPA